MKRLGARLTSAFFIAGLGLVALASTSCSVTSQVNSIFMALDGEGNRPRDTFYPDTTAIFCDIDWVGRDPDMTLNAFIHQHKGEQVIGTGSLVSVERLYAVGEVDPGEQRSIVSFSWTLQSDNGGPAPFPVGEYTCDIEVNGVSAGNSKFEITYPGCNRTDPSNCSGGLPPPGTDCPLGGAALPGSICLGIYRTGAQCPSTNNTANPTDCTCDDASGLWQCQD
jgi:hypothetical protein